METVIAKCHQGDRLTVKFMGDKIMCGTASAKLTPYEYATKLIKECESKRTTLVLRYLDMIETYTRGGKKDDQMDDIVKEIHTLDDLIHNYKNEYINSLQQQQNNDLKKEIEESLIASKTKMGTTSSFDLTLSKFLAMEHTKRKALFQEWKQREASWDNNILIPYEPLPSQKQVPLKPLPVIPSKSSTPNTGKPVGLSDKAKTEIKAKIKTKLSTLFKFKNMEECQSKARSKPFYQSKEEILKLIAENEHLKKLMPSNYKTLNKEQLCKYLLPELQ